MKNAGLEIHKFGVGRFFGTHAVSRIIDDHAAGQVVRFDGVAMITQTTRGADYVERGQMVMPSGQSFQAERRYIWQDDGSDIRVLFGDGSAFHHFDPAGGGAATEHLCGADMYRGGYDFSAWPNWSLTWDVAGPRKDYRSVTVYRPR